jgi:hypothetical protein
MVTNRGLLEGRDDLSIPLDEDTVLYLIQHIYSAQIVVMFPLRETHPKCWEPRTREPRSISQTVRRISNPKSTRESAPWLLTPITRVPYSEDMFIADVFK